MTTTGNEAREALESVIAARLTWASMHWGTERVDRDAWPNIAAAIIAAGWKSPAEVEQAQRAAWFEGFEVGTEAGARWMENGGPDDDDVCPYRDSQPEPPEVFPGTHAALDGLTIRAALAGDGA